MKQIKQVFFGKRDSKFKELFICEKSPYPSETSQLSVTSAEWYIPFVKTNRLHENGFILPR